MNNWQKFLISLRICLLASVLLSATSLAQMTVPSTGNNSYTVCAGNIYDFGGSAGDYDISWSGYSVIYPSVAGNMVQISGTSAGEACCDYVRIYNGVGITGTVLGTYYMSNAIPTITSIAAGGELTIQFVSDGSVNGAGFDITIACVAPDVTPPTNVGCSTPANAATDVSISQSLTCLVATDAYPGLNATPYQIQIATNTAFTTGLQTSAWQAGTSWTPPIALTAGTVYYWQVRARDKAGTPNVSAWCGTVNTAGYWSFTTVATVPGAVTWAATDHSNTTTSITWNWNAASVATSYERSYDGGVWTDMGNVLTYTKSSLSANTQHSLNVRGKNSLGTGTEAGVNSKYTSQNTPTAITFSGVTTTSITATASGTFPNQALGSSGVYIRNSTNVTNSGWMTATTAWVNAGLTAATTYSYYAKARNGDADETAETGVYTQTTGEMMVPSTGNNSYTVCAGNIYDFGGSAGNYDISWSGYSVIYPSDAGNKVRISGTSAGEACCDYVSIFNGVGTGSLIGTYYMNTAIPTITSTAAGGELTIRFISDGSIVGAGFNIAISYLDVTPPTNVGCSTPANAATGVSASPSLTCLVATGGCSGLNATPYQIQIATNTAFTTDLQTSAWQAGTSWTPPTALTGSTVYYWQIRARDNVATPNVSDWCGTVNTAGYWSFTTAPFAVELVDFSAIGRDGYIEIQWRTEAEIDNTKWLIMRNPSYGGVQPDESEEWEQIAELPAKGSLSEYTYIDSLIGLDKSSPYWYKLGDVDRGGNITWHSPIEVSLKAIQYSLYLHTPNPSPFKDKVKLEYQLPGWNYNPATPVSLKIYDTSGRLIKVLVDEEQRPGRYIILWDGKDRDGNLVSSGTYFYSLKVDGQLTRKLIHIK